MAHRVIGPTQIFNRPLDAEIQRQLQEDTSCCTMILRNRFVGYLIWNPEQKAWRVHARVSHRHCIEVEAIDIESAVLAIESDLGLPRML